MKKTTALAVGISSATLFSGMAQGAFLGSLLCHKHAGSCYAGGNGGEYSLECSGEGKSGITGELDGKACTVWCESDGVTIDKCRSNNLY